MSGTAAGEKRRWAVPQQDFGIYRSSLFCPDFPNVDGACLTAERLAEVRENPMIRILSADKELVDCDISDMELLAC